MAGISDECVLIESAGGGAGAADAARLEHRRAGLRRQPSPGRSTTGWESPRRRSSRSRATWRATSDRRGSGSTWSRRDRWERWRPAGSPASSSSPTCGARQAPLGWDLEDPVPVARAICWLLSDYSAGDQRRDRPRRRRLSRRRRARPAAPDRPWSDASLSGTGRLGLSAAARALPAASSGVTWRPAPLTSTAGLHRVLGTRQIGGGGQLVGDRDPGRPQLAAAGVGASAPVLQRRESRAADRHVALAVAPGAAEGVGDQHRRGRAEQLGKPRAQRPGRGVGIDGSRISVSSSGALDASTPALAHTKPWWVTAIRTPFAARRTSRVSSRTT